MVGTTKPICNDNRNCDELGVTLIELLVALLITSMILITLVYVLRAEQTDYQTNVQRSQVISSVTATYDGLRAFLLQANGEPLHVTSTGVSWQNGTQNYSVTLQNVNNTSYYLLTYGNGQTMKLSGVNTSFQGSTFQFDAASSNLVDFHIVATSTGITQLPYVFTGDTKFSTQGVQLT